MPGPGAGSEMPPLDSIGGQSGEGGQPPPEQCVAELRTRLEDRPTVAQCVTWGANRYRCICDMQRCGGPSGPITGGDADGGADNAGCRFDVEASTCGAALRDGCELASGQNGFCETLSGEQSVACFALPAGGHECHCPDRTEPVMSTVQDCKSALVRACASD